MAVQTLTYDNKQFLNQNSDIADVNKVNDTDMNEIKSVVNNNALEVTNITGQILWTNPNPNSSFAGQTITLSSSDYDMYEVLFYGSQTGADTITSGRIPKGKNAFLQQIYDLGGGAQVRNRSVKYVSDTSLNITDATINGTTINSQNIPVYIIGYKTGLFN